MNDQTEAIEERPRIEVHAAARYAKRKAVAVEALRWLLVLPGAVLAAKVVELLTYFVPDDAFCGVIQPGGILFGSIRGFWWGFAFVMAAALIAPRGQRIVGIIAASVVSTLAIVLDVMVLTSTADRRLAVPMVAMIVGAIISAIGVCTNDEFATA